MAIAKRSAHEAEEDPWNAHSSMMTLASSILLAVIFLILLGLLIIWLTVNPRQLTYSVEEAFVSNVNCNTTTSRLVTADFDIRLLATNPNHRVSFSYDSMKVSVESQGHTLASCHVPRFTQEKDNSTLLPVNLTSHDVVLPESMLSHWMDWNRSEDIKIDMIMEASVTFTAQHWKPDHCTIRVFCADVAAHKSRDKASSKQTVCNVEL